MSDIAVITISFNNLADLQRTCASVDSQSVKPEAHWIINGSTSDEIAGWLAATPQPAYRKWINERDKGIADAFNKGIRHAAQPVLHLLNSGDCYASADVLEAVTAFLLQHPHAQWISGNIAITRAGKPVVVGKPFDRSKLYRGMRSVSHPTWFVKKAVYERVGGFNGAYRIAMDYDMMCRIADEPYAYLDKLIVQFDDTGISSAQYLPSLKENKRVYTMHFGPSLLLEIWQLRLKLLHYLLQTAFGKWLFHLKKKAGMENW
ncbi:glycosyltransferase [Sediminibacterium soli]|uniref:glycosyltransferase n=1 Tax=Sediminibacterium soli TaxID=2698829 RepID=UPI0013797E6D|nr:glycosyltransferase [Sediminibacterium soli]NCI46617.1 glycosyltransferase [Sediminibacterium soli]